MENIPMCMYKQLNQALCGSGGSCVKPDQLPQVMSLESVLAGAED